MNKSRGFTLLEILLVVGIIAILAGIVILALNPTKQFAQVRNTQRKANLSELNKALYQYYIDNSRYPTSLTTTLTEICDTEATSTGHSLNCTNRTDLSYLVPTYLVAIPTDPQATGTSTGYYVSKNTANKVVLYAGTTELGSTVSVGPLSDSVAPINLISFWTFDGNASDSVGGNNGTIVGATATTGVKGSANTAYAFNGTSQYIDVGTFNPLTSGNVTISAWIKPGSQPGSDGYVNGYVALKGSDVLANSYGLNVFTPTRYDYNMNNLGASMMVFRPSGYAGASSISATTSAGLLNDSMWHFVVGVIEGNSISIYLDGAIKNSVTFTGTINSTTNNFWIGAQNRGGYNYPFNGPIDNVRVYSRALSAQEILNIYNAEKP